MHLVGIIYETEVGVMLRPVISRRGKGTRVSRERQSLESVMKIVGKYSQVSYIKSTAKYVPRDGVFRCNVGGRGECQAWTSTSCVVLLFINPYPTAFPYGNGMVLHFYQQQESSTTKTVHKVINKGLKTYV